MKHPDAIEVIEFPSGHIMEYTQKILVAFAIAFLGFLSLSSAAYIKKDFDFTKNLEKNFGFELPRTLREKRQSEHFDFSAAEDTAKLENLSEFEKIHDRRTIAEEIQEINLKHEKLEEQEKRSAHKENNDTEENTQDEAVPYKSVHNVMHALMYADDEDLAEKLQELRENSTDSDGNLSKLLKRNLQYNEYPLLASHILGTDFSEEIPLERLDGHSCESEAFDFGHSHHSGLLVHEFCCELRKFPHYILHSARNLKSELSLGPLITEEFEGDILGSFYRHTPRLLETIIKEPHHLLLLPEIIRDVVPCHSILHAFQRIRHTFFKALHFIHNLFREHLLHVIERFFLHHHLGLHLLRILHHFGKLHLLEKIGCILPTEEILTKPIPVTFYDELYAPEYHHSFNEVIATIRGIHDGYFASGIHHLLRSGMQTFTSASTSSTITSFLSTIPFLNNVVPYFNAITTNSATSLSSVDVNSVANPIFENFVPVVGSIIDNFSPVIGPLNGLGSVVSLIQPIFPVETETVISGASPIFNVVSPVVTPVIESPIISPLVGYGSVVKPVASVYPAATEKVISSASSTASASIVDASNPIVNHVVESPVINPVGYGSVVSPVAEKVTSSASSAASASIVDVNSPAVSPVGLVRGPVNYLAGLGSEAPIATEVTSSATSSASATVETQQLPVVVDEPEVVPYVAPVTVPTLYGKGGNLPFPFPFPLPRPFPSSLSSSATAVSQSTSSVSVAESAPVVEAVPEVVPYVAPVAVPTLYGKGGKFPFPIPRPSSLPSSVSETTAVSQSTSSVTVAESTPAVIPVVETVPEVADCASGPIVVPNTVDQTVTATASAAATVSSTADVATIPVSSAPLGLVNIEPTIAPVEVASASASSSATVSTTNQLAEPAPFVGFNYPGYRLTRPGFFSSLKPSSALASAVAAASSGTVSTASSTTSVISRQNFNFVLPREKIINVLGSDCLLPGDIVSVTLKNKSVLYGSVLDAVSPIRFGFLRPRPYGALLRKGARAWNIRHSDFTDPECLEIFNDPVLLAY